MRPPHVRQSLIGCVVAALNVVLPRLAHAQAATIHDRIAEYFRIVPQGVLPSGDTLVTWRADGPILYHTAQRSGTTVRAGMFRNDALIGAAEVAWAANGPASFSVRWLGNSPLQLQGRVENGQLSLSGARDSRITVPTGAWAIAEFGMDDLMLPLIDQLSVNPQPIAVFRPFAGKWDTVTASVSVRGEFRVMQLVDSKGKRTWCATDARRQSCLWIQESTSATERRPLEGTETFKTFERAKASLLKLS